MLLLHDPVAAAEPTEPEQMYERLKEAEKHADRLLGDRWYKLVRQRQWVDSSGKHKTYARYVDHDPNLQSVTLSILVKKGETPTYKEATIPLARLSKNDQAAVKRIAMMRSQVEEALADAPDISTAPGETALAEGEPYDRGIETPQAPAEVPPPPAQLAAMAALEPWRTDFAAFSNNLSPQQNEQGQWVVSFNTMPALDAVYQQEQMIHQLKTGGGQFPPAAMAVGAEQRQLGEAPRPDVEAPAAGPDPAAAPPVEAAAPGGSANGIPRSAMFMMGAQYGWSRGGLGEVSWETTVQGASEAGQPLLHDLQLPSPLTLELTPDMASAAEFARLKPGERIRFIGRFERLGGFNDPPKIVLKVRPVTASANTRAAAPTRELYGRAPR